MSSLEMTTSEDPNLPASSPSVVVLVHGIRTPGEWMIAIKPVLEAAGFRVAATNYGRLDAFRFWLPIPWVRRSAVQHVWTDIRRTMQLHKTDTVSFIAHSYGTYVVAKILSREFDFAAHRLIFCGSILSRRFPFEQIGKRFKTPVLNEISTKDIWPLVAKSVTWGYDSSGTHGFMRPDVEDRRHKDLGHSDFLTAEFCKKYWVPFLRDGTVVPANPEGVKVPLWARVFSYVPVKFLLLVVLAIVTVGTGDRRETVTDFVKLRVSMGDLGKQGPGNKNVVRAAWLAGSGLNTIIQEFAKKKILTANIRAVISTTRPFLEELGVPVFRSEEVSKEGFLKEHGLPLTESIASALEADHGKDISAVFRIAKNIVPTTLAMKDYIGDASYRATIKARETGVRGLTGAVDDPLGDVAILPKELKDEWIALLDELMSEKFSDEMTDRIDAWRVKVLQWAMGGSEEDR